MNAPSRPRCSTASKPTCAQQPQPQAHLALRPNLRWLSTARALATAAALILLLCHKHAPKRIRRDSKSSHPRSIFVADHIRRRYRSANPTPKSKSESRTAHKPRLRNVARSDEPEVLVPPDERIALEHFIAQWNGRADLPPRSLKPLQSAGTSVTRVLEIPDIETASSCRATDSGTSTAAVERSPNRNHYSE